VFSRRGRRLLAAEEDYEDDESLKVHAGLTTPGQACLTSPALLEGPRTDELELCQAGWGMGRPTEGAYWVWRMAEFPQSRVKTLSVWRLHGAARGSSCS